MILTDVTSQGLYFCVALFCGIVCGVYYDILYALKRLTNSGRIVEFVFDIVFFALSILTIFHFFYLANGFQIKWYMALGFVAGFCIERINFKKPVAIVSEKVYNIFEKRIKSVRSRIQSYLSKKAAAKNAKKADAQKAAAARALPGNAFADKAKKEQG